MTREYAVRYTGYQDLRVQTLVAEIDDGPGDRAAALELLELARHLQATRSGLLPSDAHLVTRTDPDSEWVAETETAS